jgi:hypothetical protein
MQLRRRSIFSTLPAWTCHLCAAVLILGAAALHIAYLTQNCPLDLAPDEAHYWDWSRNLDWSYYSKGPLVAYLIRASCELFGTWSVEQTGTLMPAVRFPAVVCGALLLLSLYALSVRIHGSESLALAVVAMALTLPLIAVGSTLMTIDAPYTCCWGWALVFGHIAVTRGSWWAWLTTGFLVGIGILAKYTMILFLPSVGLFLLATPALRPHLLQPAFWIMCVVAGLCCLPILVWNMQHDWVTVRHLLGLSGLQDPAEKGGIHWLGPLAYLGGQCAVLLVYWFVVWLAAMIAHQPLAESNANLRYLWFLSAPMFLAFLVLSPKTGGGELNWPVTAYLSGFVLAAGWLSRQLNSPVVWYRRSHSAALTVSCLVGIVLTGFAHYSDRLYPLLGRITGPPTAEKPYPVRGLDPTCRLRGWHFLAAELDKVVAEVAAQEGQRPALAASSWTLPGELGVYSEGHPRVYSVGPVVGERHSQYDLWPNPVRDGEEFDGRTFVIVGGLTDKAKAAFASDRITKREVTFLEHGQPIATWEIWICPGFQGFSADSETGNRSRHY